jgi:hypothetical protein
MMESIVSLETTMQTRRRDSQRASVLFVLSVLGGIGAALLELPAVGFLCCASAVFFLATGLWLTMRYYRAFFAFHQARGLSREEIIRLWHALYPSSGGD